MSTSNRKNLFGTTTSVEKVSSGDPDDSVDNYTEDEWTEILELLEDESRLDASMNSLFDENVFKKVNDAYTSVLDENLKNCDTLCAPMPSVIAADYGNETHGHVSPMTQDYSQFSENSQFGSPSPNGPSMKDNQPAATPLTANRMAAILGTPTKKATPSASEQSPASPESSTGSGSTASSIRSRSLQEDPQFKSNLGIVPAEMTPLDEHETLMKNSDNVSLAFHSVGLSVLSQKLRGDNMKNLEELFKKGKASNVYKVLANILFRRNVEIDVRKEAEHGKPAEKQMREVWGNLVTDNAKAHGKTMCYLCGGPIVNVAGGVSPEMEHKLPCAVYYGSFDSIYRTYGEILLKWLYFLEQQPNEALELYTTINGTGGTQSSFSGYIVVTDAFDKLYSAFLGWLDMDDNKNQGSLFTQSERDSFKYTLNAYMNEFAYSHHFCNQLKSNHDLGDNKVCEEYFNALNLAASKKDIKSINGFVAALPIPEKANQEWDNIRGGLGITAEETNGTNVETRKASVIAQMNYIKKIASDHANELNLTKKRSMIRAIKEIIRNSKPIDAAAMSGQDGKKVTKKVRKMLNSQATNIVHDMVVNTNISEPNQNNATKASVFLNMLKALPEGPEGVRTSVGTPASGRQRPKLVADIVKNVLPYYVDNATTILQNAYDMPINAKRSLDSPFVLPIVKNKIKHRLSEYANNLSDIVINLNTRLENFKVNNEDWSALMSQANVMIANMKNISGVQLVAIQEEEGSQDDNQTNDFSGDIVNAADSPLKKPRPNTGGSHRGGTRRRYRKKGTTRKRKIRKNASKKRGKKRARTRRKARKSKR